MSCPCEPASFKPNVRIGARYGKASKHSGHSCPHPERLELPKMIHRQRLQRQFPDQSMGVLLKIEGNCSCLKAKVAHMVGHLPGVAVCAAEAKAFAQVGAHNIAIQHFHAASTGSQALLYSLGKGAFTGAGEACEPDGYAFIGHAGWFSFLEKLCLNYGTELLQWKDAKPMNS